MGRSERPRSAARLRPGLFLAAMRQTPEPLRPGTAYEQDMKPERDFSVTERNFILQQGFEEPAAQTCHLRYSALAFQPRVVALMLLAGLVLQSPLVFLALAAVLWWGALLPQWNLFDAVYNRTAGSRPGAMRLGPAPAPRRFAQGMAGSFALLIGVALLLDWRVLAYVLEAFLALAVIALVFGRFCLGSFLYHVLMGQWEFARRTLPWTRH